MKILLPVILMILSLSAKADFYSNGLARTFRVGTWMMTGEGTTSGENLTGLKSKPEVNPQKLQPLYFAGIKGHRDWMSDWYIKYLKGDYLVFDPIKVSRFTMDQVDLTYSPFRPLDIEFGFGLKYMFLTYQEEYFFANFTNKHHTDLLIPIVYAEKEFQLSGFVWSFELRGFGTGSKLYVDFTTFAEVQLLGDLRTSFGYRYYKLKRSSNELAFDLTLSGPQIDLAYSF